MEVPAAFIPSGDISKLIAHSRPNQGPYEILYRKLHADPEISLQESATAAVVGSHLRSLKDFHIRMNIGGHGVVGILRNGAGKTVLLRADMDALPLEEKTGLEYASDKRMIDITDNVEKPVMHACGHDMHITSLLAAAELLHTCRASWKGTLILLFQPNEERGAGAQAMVDDGLYDPEKHAIPRPDVILGAHVMPLRAGKLNTRKGIFGSAADSYKVTIYGRGGHGSRPHTTVDPVVLACSIVMKLQTIVSRETNPQDAVVVTVGSLHVGTAENIISGEATLQINTRTFNAESRTRVRAAIVRIINAECQAAGSPKTPLIEDTSSFPLLHNDEAATDIVSKAMKDHFGGDFSPEGPISMGSEDFGNLSISTPTCFWNYGGIDQQCWDDAERRGMIVEIPGIYRRVGCKYHLNLTLRLGNHSPFFKLAIQPTLQVAIDAYATAALAFLH
jgi:amidohydrolase